jgi:uncharacterized membrane protein YgcG
MTADVRTLDVVRRAVRCVVEQTPELQHRPELRRTIARNMVGVSVAAAELLEAERRFDEQVAGRAQHANGAAPTERKRRTAPLAAAQAAGDIHRRTAVNAAAGVLQSTRQAIDFPGFVTSLITGVFQAMSTSTIQQLEAYANLLESVNASTGSFAASSITPGRAATWAAGQFQELELTGDPPRLSVKEDAEMPNADALRAALGASAEEVSNIDGDELEETLLPLVARKLARDRQSMLATMVLMGMNRIVVDSGRIHASMELQVDARSTAEQTQAERFDTRVSTAASGSFGMGMWGASASMSATVGYVRSDEQFTREDIALRAGLRSSVDIGFRTEPLQLDRMANSQSVNRIRERSMVPETERTMAAGGAPANLLAPITRNTAAPNFGNIPDLMTPPTPPTPGQATTPAGEAGSSEGSDSGEPGDSGGSGDSSDASGSGDAGGGSADTGGGGDAAGGDAAATDTGGGGDGAATEEGA